MTLEAGAARREQPMVRVAINGFGRTGRAALRAAHGAAADAGVEVVAVNDLGDPTALVTLLERDSVHGRFGVPVSVDGSTVSVGGRPIRFLAEPDVGSLPWKELEVDVVIESTGHLTTREAAAGHVAAGARRVVVSAPGKGMDATLVVGVNHESFDPARHVVVSNASCTTNCLAVLAKVLDDAVGIEDGLMSTVHAYTGDQRLVDALHKDPRRSRAAAVNIVPTTTGAARTTGEVLPPVRGHLDGLALRVPVADGSLTDLVAVVTRRATVDDVNRAYAAAAADGPLAGVLEYGEDWLVSTDIVGSPASCIFDPGLTMVTGRLVKVLGWYDNETGYSNRLVELAALVGRA
jgi:glyceraldehyde 3-phosphate dehydrogenase